MRAEVISIGDELTSGQRLDTNSQWLSERLGELGVPVVFHSTVADDLAANVLVFRQAVQRADIIVASGGLGPTADDLTRQALADMAGVALQQDDAALAHIVALFARRQRPMPPANHVQALFPQGSRAISNPHGSAPGIDLDAPRGDQSAARIFALPGVPAEMKEMWQATVGPAIRQMQAARGVRNVLVHHRIRCFGVGESDLEAMLPDLIRRGRQPQVGITVSQATITLRITAAAESPAAARLVMAPTIGTIHECLGDLIYGEEEDELQDAVVRLLSARGQTLAVAEWGTGGLVVLGLCTADPPGASFLGGIVVRGRQQALQFAAIPATGGALGAPETLIKAMATKAREQLTADFGLAIGPLPSPDGATGGAIHFALATHEGVFDKSAPFSGHPDILMPRAAKQALDFLRLRISKPN